MILGSGLLAIVIKSVWDGIRKKIIRHKLWKNVVYEIFWNMNITSLNYEESIKVLKKPMEPGVVHSYNYTAWETLLQSGFLKDLAFEKIKILDLFYMRIKIIEDEIKRFHTLPFVDRQAKVNLDILQRSLNRIAIFYNSMQNSKFLKKCLDKYTKSYIQDYSHIFSDFELIPPGELSQKS